MADFDAQQAHAHAQAHQNRPDHDQARMDHLEQTIARMGNALNNLQHVPPPAPPPQQPRIHYNLNLTPPPSLLWLTAPTSYFPNETLAFSGRQ